jgi:hypothetical protein
VQLGPHQIHEGDESTNPAYQPRVALNLRSAAMPITRLPGGAVKVWRELAQFHAVPLPVLILVTMPSPGHAVYELTNGSDMSATQEPLPVAPSFGFPWHAVTV